MKPLVPKLLSSALMILAIAMNGGDATAESFPSKPIRIISPFSAGSPPDAFGRLIAQQVSGSLGQSVVVETRPGAGTTLGTKAGAMADPDGYTLVQVNAALSYAPVLYPNPGYDPAKSFAPVALLATLPRGWSRVGHRPMAIAVVVALWAIVLLEDQDTLWYLAYRFVPGGTAIRAVARAGLVVLIPAAIGFAAFFAAPWAGRRPLVAGFVFACCMIEQGMTTPAYDKDLNAIFVSVGNPSPDLDGSVRPGDNLYTDAIVAIDATSGKTKWYYQTVPHDVWDLDATSPPVVTTLGGKKVVVHSGKTAWVYVLDAATGKLVRKTENFTPQENMFALPTEKGTRMLPGANGGSEWSPISVDPSAGYAYVAGLHQPMNYITHSAPWEKGKLWLGSAFVAIPGEEQYGLFSAVDLKTGKIAWQNKVPQPMMGGALATAGGLTFTGEGNGNFNAYDSKSGKLLWQFNGGAGCNSAPMTFMHGGEQFIAVACGGNFQLSYPLGNSVYVFGLPKRTAMAK